MVTEKSIFPKDDACEIASIFYRHFGNAGSLRPEVFGISAKPESFYYVFAPEVKYSLTDQNLYLNGNLAVTISKAHCPWVLLHLNGCEGEILCWLDLNQLDNEKFSLIPDKSNTADSSEKKTYLAKFAGVDIRMHAFIIKSYVSTKWKNFVEDIEYSITSHMLNGYKSKEM